MMVGLLEEEPRWRAPSLGVIPDAFGAINAWEMPVAAGPTPALIETGLLRSVPTPGGFSEAKRLLPGATCVDVPRTDIYTID
jgi:hypothetical protein